MINWLVQYDLVCLQGGRLFTFLTKHIYMERNKGKQNKHKKR